MKTKLKTVSVRIITVVLAVLSSLFMFDFYKSLSGFIANGFREPLTMIPLISSYILPVLCFLFFFYDFYIKKACKVANIIYSALTFIWANVNLVIIFINITLFTSNNSLGVYDTLFSIFVKFPYDAIVINLFLAAMQIVNFIAVFKGGKIAELKDSLKQYGMFELSLGEYLPLSVLAILAFAFFGDALNAFCAIENTLYDAKYLFLILWAMTPICNLLCLVIKPDTRFTKTRSRAIALGVQILVNVLFLVLLLIFEANDPGFIIQIGKPLFPITFSVSLPIEMIAFVLIGAISIVVYAIRLVLLFIKKQEK